MKTIFIILFVCILASTRIQSKPTKSHKFFNNNPMLSEDLYEGDIKLEENVNKNLHYLDWIQG